MKILIAISGKGSIAASIMYKSKAYNKNSNYEVSNVLRLGEDSKYYMRYFAGIRVSTMVYVLPEDFEWMLSNYMKKHNCDFLVLAGYNKILSPEFVKKWKNKILNIHPGLLPETAGLYGLNVHRKILNLEGERFPYTKAYVHLVNKKVDEGKILATSPEIPVLDNDTPETLQERVKQEEYKLYPIVLNQISTGEIVI